MYKQQMNIIGKETSQDGTIKFLMQLPQDDIIIETVALPFFKKYTLCLSTQVGCRFACTFCFTGRQTFIRNLSANEIITQYTTVRNYLREEGLCLRTPNIVFMGQGEPLDNFESLKQSIDYLSNTNGLKIGPRQITLSTVGIPDGLMRLPELPPVNIALSLHASNNQKRSSIIPINKKYPIESIFEILRTVPLLKRQYITIEYLLIKNFNDQEDDAVELEKLLRPLKSIINIIPFNSNALLPFISPTSDDINRFKSLLVNLKLRTMVRQSKGADINATCGQLRYKSSTLMGH